MIKNFYEKDPDTITHVKHLALRGKSIKHKAIKFIKHEDKSIAWYSRRWWNSCTSEDEKKEIESTFTEICI